MATIVDYASLTQAIADFSHNSLLTSGSPPYSDYFIQGAQEAVEKDLFDLNFGNGIRFQENAYAPSVIQGGVLPVPSDWLAPKVFYVSDGDGDQGTLIFKAAAWIGDNYPLRQAQGIPAYIARDVMAPASFTASIASGVLTVTNLASGLIQSGLVLADTTNDIPTGPGAAIIVTGETTGTGSTGTYPVASVSPLSPSLTVNSESMTGGGSVFVFGPYPDSNYQVSGTYYQKAPLLSGSNTTNWMVLNAPLMLHAACMVECAKFLLDDTMLQRWQGQYQARLKALVDQDKAERWASSTMQIEVG